MHVMILGQTQSGKSSLAIKACKEYIAAGKGVIVYDPLFSTMWCQEGIVVYNDLDAFMADCRTRRQCAVVIDEFGLACRKAKETGIDLLPAATTFRHWGHRSHFIAQRYTMIPPTIRDQCAYLYSFRLSKKDAEFMASEFLDDSLLEIAELERGQYVAKVRHSPASRRLLFRP